MSHVLLPLDSSHCDAVTELAVAIGELVGVEAMPHWPHPHITLVAHEGLSLSAAASALEAVAAATPPFSVHAHGFGCFCGDHESGLSLHVDVVRTGELDLLHRRVSGALSVAGAKIARWCEPDRWTPHITLLDHGLDAERLGTAATWLARRHHPSWQVGVDRLTVTGGWHDRAQPGIDVRLGGRLGSIAPSAYSRCRSGCC